MKKLFGIVKNNKIWSAISSVLIVVGGAAYVPVVSIGQEASQSSVEYYCERNPEAEECKDEEE